MKSRRLLLPITIISVGLSVALAGSEITSYRKDIRPTSLVSRVSARHVQSVRSGNAGKADNEDTVALNVTASNDIASDVTVSNTTTNALVLEFGQNHPEASDYVNNFDKYEGRVFNTNVSLDLKKGTIPLFIQWDKRWGYANYGKSYVGISGCGPTCLSMVVCGLKDDPTATPYDVSRYAEEKGYYVSGTGTSWALMTNGATHYGLTYTNGSVTAGYILGNLSAKSPMICSMKPGDFTTQGHFIVLTGVDKNGRIIINDPVSPEHSARHWNVDELIPQIKSIWKYSYL